MKVARRIPALLSAIVLAAHFFRAGRPILTVFSLLVSVLFFVPRPPADLAARAFLLAGTVVWVLTAFRIGRVRLAIGEPFVRMAVILGAVAAFTLVSAMILPLPRTRTADSQER